jgi:hypothetical protein
MILEEDAHWSKSISGTHINIKNRHNISSQLREHTLDSMYFVEEKQLFPLETYCLSIKSLKVPQSVTFNHLSEIKDLTQDAQEHTQPLSDIHRMDQKPELDFHLVPERQFQEIAEPQLALLLEEDVTKNPS